mmetsp:Transcript_20995/g.41176  ORF Transcript_20995/g.41176 Transcript_20995/m.41176 type:complete len:445 (-) Transcript_20995:21-1355(-)
MTLTTVSHACTISMCRDRLDRSTTVEHLHLAGRGCWHFVFMKCKSTGVFLKIREKGVRACLLAESREFCVHPDDLRTDASGFGNTSGYCGLVPCFLAPESGRLNSRLTKGRKKANFLGLSHGLESLKHGATKLGRGLGDKSTSILEGLHLGLGSTLASRNDGSCMAHTTARRRGKSSNEADDGLVGVSVLLEPLRCLLLSSSTNLTNHDNTLSLRVVGEPLEAVNEVGSVEGVTANSDNSGLAKTCLSGLRDSFVGEGSRTGHNTDLTGGVNVAGHDTDLALVGLDDARAVRSDETGGGLALQMPLDLEHVLLGDTLSNANDERHLSLDGLKNSTGSDRGRDKDHRGINTNGILGLLDGVEHGETKVLLTTLAGAGASDHLSAIRDGLLTVESTLLTGKSLAENLGVLVNPDVGGGGECTGRHHSGRALSAKYRSCQHVCFGGV